MFSTKERVLNEDLK